MNFDWKSFSRGRGNSPFEISSAQYRQELSKLLQTALPTPFSSKLQNSCCFKLRASCELTADYTRSYGRFLLCAHGKRMRIGPAHWSCQIKDFAPHRKKRTLCHLFIPLPSIKEKIYCSTLYTYSAQCVQLMQALLDMILSWKRNRRQHNANIVSPKQRRYAQSKKPECSNAALQHI